MNVKIEVIKEHIAEGIQSSSSCPIALALKELLHREVSVDRWVITVYGNEEDRYFQTPSTACVFIAAYDNVALHEARQMEPFEFELNLPEALLRESVEI